MKPFVFFPLLCVFFSSWITVVLSFDVGVIEVTDGCGNIIGYLDKYFDGSNEYNVGNLTDALCVQFNQPFSPTDTFNVYALNGDPVTYNLRLVGVTRTADPDAPLIGPGSRGDVHFAPLPRPFPSTLPIHQLLDANFDPVYVETNVWSLSNDNTLTLKYTNPTGTTVPVTPFSYYDDEFVGLEALGDVAVHLEYYNDIIHFPIQLKFASSHVCDGLTLLNIPTPTPTPTRTPTPTLTPTPTPTSPTCAGSAKGGGSTKGGGSKKGKKKNSKSVGKSDKSKSVAGKGAGKCSGGSTKSNKKTKDKKQKGGKSTKGGQGGGKGGKETTVPSPPLTKTTGSNKGGKKNKKGAGKSTGKKNKKDKKAEKQQKAKDQLNALSSSSSTTSITTTTKTSAPDLFSVNALDASLPTPTTPDVNSDILISAPIFGHIHHIVDEAPLNLSVVTVYLNITNTNTTNTTNTTNSTNTSSIDSLSLDDGADFTQVQFKTFVVPPKTWRRGGQNLLAVRSGSVHRERRLMKQDKKKKSPREQSHSSPLFQRATGRRS